VVSQDKLMNAKEEIKKAVKQCLAKSLHRFMSKTKGEFVKFARDDILPLAMSEHDCDERANLELFSERFVDVLIGKMTEEVVYSFVEAVQDNIQGTSTLPEGLAKAYIDMSNSEIIRQSIDGKITKTKEGEIE